MSSLFRDLTLKSGGKLVLIFFLGLSHFSCATKASEFIFGKPQEEKSTEIPTATPAQPARFKADNLTGGETTPIPKQKIPAGFMVTDKDQDAPVDTETASDKASKEIPENSLGAGVLAGDRNEVVFLPTTGKEFVVITAGQANIRSGPGADYSIIGQLTKGDRYELVGEYGDVLNGEPWYKIVDDKKRVGYVWGKLSKKTTAKSTGFGSDSDSLKKIETKDVLTPPIPDELKKTGEISLNFEIVDIREIIQTFCELLKLDYIIEPGIAGTITLHTSNKIPVSSLFKVFEQILTLNNIAIVKKGSFYHFLPMMEAKSVPIGIYHADSKLDIPDEDRLIIQIVPLKYIPAKSIQAMIAPLLSKNAHFISLDDRNTLIIVEIASNMRRLVEIIGALDTNTLDKTDIELYTINHNSASEISKNLQNIFTNLGYQAQGPLSLKFVTLKKMNSILVVNSFPDLIPTVEYWIKKLDQPIVRDKISTYVYYLQNAEAPKMAGLLKQLFREKKVKKVGEESREAPKVVGTVAKKAPAAPKSLTFEPKVNVDTSSTSEISTGEILGEVIILADEDTNSLLVRTNPRNYPAIKETIKKLDLMPLQVLIEVMIMDVTLDDKTSFGVEWALKNQFGHGTNFSANNNQGFGIGGPSLTQPTSILSSAPGTLGLFVGATDKILGMLQAWGIKDKANVLSSPVIITSENKPATISITNQEPITSSTLTTPTGGNPVVQSSVQYKDVGIKLSVTPQINDQRFVNLKISQEVSAVTDTSGANPKFFTRSADTNVVVKDKQTIIVGGLMETTKSESRQGIPYLRKIPVFGKLFGFDKDGVTKKELLIFITPHVITNEQEGSDLTLHFREKLKFLKEETKHISVGEEKPRGQTP